MASTLTAAVLSKYTNKNFVETGTLWGDGIELALNSGFEKIYSIDINPDCVAKTKERFSEQVAQGRVEILHGDTIELFPKILAELKTPTTFWLDAHWDGGPEGQKKAPLLEELLALANHDIKTHTLLIDDRRCFGAQNHTWGGYLTELDVMKAIAAVNSKYQIYYEDGFVPNDIIAAVVK